MSNSNLKINLYKNLDRHNSVFYIGKLKGPFNINCKDGVCLIVFVSDEGNEEIQICSMDKNDIKQND